MGTLEPLATSEFPHAKYEVMTDITIDQHVPIKLANSYQQ
jgi:hypothetical protein